MFIDIHNHIAWDIDDGMESKEQAEVTLRDAKKDGIHAIVATPHYIPGVHSASDIETIKERVQETKALAKTYGIEVYSGAEIFLNHEYMDMMEDNLFQTLNDTKYLLVEFDVRKDIANNDDAEDILYELKVHGYIPVIAHVERYFHSGLDVERVSEWIASGYSIQVNRTSLLGKHGQRSEKNVHELMKLGFVHVVASDTHRASGYRICRMQDVYENIKSLYGKENADLLCIKNPQHMLHGEELENMSIVKQSIWKRLLKR